MDKSYNPSEYSKPIELQRPDIVPPTEPVFTQVIFDKLKNKVQLKWIPSASDDAEHYLLKRIAISDSVVDTIGQWRSKEKPHIQWEDNPLPGLYQYHLEVRDAAGNMSVAQSSFVRVADYFPNIVENLKVEVQPRGEMEKQVLVKWSKCNKAERYSIYKSTSGGPLITIKTVSADNTQFVDVAVSEGNVYEYKVKATFQNGASTKLSKGVKVKL